MPHACKGNPCETASFARLRLSAHRQELFSKGTPRWFSAGQTQLNKHRKLQAKTDHIASMVCRPEQHWRNTRLLAQKNSIVACASRPKSAWSKDTVNFSSPSEQHRPKEPTISTGLLNVASPDLLASPMHPYHCELKLGCGCHPTRPKKLLRRQE